MSQTQGNLMYQASQFRKSGDFPYYHQHPQRFNSHRSVHVYSITRYPTSNSNRGVGRGLDRGGYRGGYNSGRGRGRYNNNFFRPRDSFFNDLEWDNYDIGSNKCKRSNRGRGRANRRNDSYYRIGSNFSSSDSELEWDDYDLRSKKEAENPTESLEIYVTEEFVPLITDKSSLSRGNIPLGAIQVRKFPQGNTKTRFPNRARAFSLNKDLLVLTSEVNNNESTFKDKAASEEIDPFDESLLRELLVLSGLQTSSTVYEKLTNRRNSDASQKSDKSPGSDAQGDSMSSESDIIDDYEPVYQDKIADSDLYALLPQDFDSPDSLLSRSLADLTDQTLYEEYGLETRRNRREGDDTLEDDKDDPATPTPSTPTTVFSPLPWTPSTPTSSVFSPLPWTPSTPTDSVFNPPLWSTLNTSCPNIPQSVTPSEKRRKASLRAKKRKKRAESEGGAGTDDGKKVKRVAPNFFVAIQVSNREIHAALTEVQRSVLEGDEKLKDAMIPIATLHLTVMVMHLASEEDVKKAKEALDECHRILSPRFNTNHLCIDFHGLGHFNNQVMFAKIKDDGATVETLYEIAEIVENNFQLHGISSTGERGFKPHLTVMKLSRAPSLRKKGVRRIKSELYKAHSNRAFGSQVMTGLQLCSINKSKGEDGYFYKASEFFFESLRPPGYSPCPVQIKEDPENEYQHIDRQEAIKDQRSAEPAQDEVDEKG